MQLLFQKTLLLLLQFEIFPLFYYLFFRSRTKEEYLRLKFKEMLLKKRGSFWNAWSLQKECINQWINQDPSGINIGYFHKRRSSIHGWGICTTWIFVPLWSTTTFAGMIGCLSINSKWTMMQLKWWYLNNKGRLDGDIWGLCMYVFVCLGVNARSQKRRNVRIWNLHS